MSKYLAIFITIFVFGLSISFNYQSKIYTSNSLLSGKSSPQFNNNKLPNITLQNPSPMLSGGFITLENGMINKPDFWGNIDYGDIARRNWTKYPVDWKKVLTSMHNAGINTVIIKYISVLDRTNQFYTFYDKDNENYGPIKEILNTAKTLNMRVYIGLWDWDNFSSQRISKKVLFGPRTAADPNDPNDLLSHTKDTAKNIWNLYKNYPAFVGWYIPMEIWNIDDKSLEGDEPASKLLNNFYSQVSKYCKYEIANGEKDKSLKDIAKAKKIAISPFFNITDTSMSTKTAEEITPIYVKILSASGVDVLLPQDSVATNRIDERSSDYLKAFHSAVDIINKNSKKAGPAIEFWVNIENFDLTVSPTAPANIERIKKQFCIARKATPSQFVTFDYYHYMNPDVPDCHIDPTSGMQTIVLEDSICIGRFNDPVVKSKHFDRNQLFDDYIKNFVNQTFNLSDADCDALTY